jgi:hypothetical protein
MKRALMALVAGLATAAAVLSNTPAESVAPTTPVPVKVIGMSAPANLWSQRINEVGACGVEARRIFASLQSDGRSQSKLIQQAVSAGMMPVISYKVPNVKTLISGGYDSWLTATRTYLDSLGVQVTATFHHEPHGDMDPADFRAGSQKFLTLMKAPDIAVGPILNGWLLDRQVSTFASYTSPSLLSQWDFVAVDSYQSGTASSPGKAMPARAVPLLANWMDAQGYPDKPIGLGEYNGHTAAAMKAAGDAILSTPEVWFGLAWNSTARFSPLTGDRLAEFQKTKADARAKKDC